MRKVFIIIISLVALFSSLSIVTAYAEVDNDPKMVVAFGDSITFGYTVDGNSYAKIYCDEKGYTLNNYAQVGMTSAQLLELLETDLDYSDASEILLWIGANDLLQTVTMYATEKGIDYNNITYEDVTIIKNAINSSEFRAAMQNAVANFEVNLVKIINDIKQRSAGKIFLFTQYNPYNGVNIVMPSTGESLNLGLITEEWIEKINIVITSLDGAKIVDTFFIIEDTEEKCVNAEINVLTNSFDFDPHLNSKGHEMVYKSLLNSHEEKNDSQNSNQTESIYIIIIVSSLLMLSAIVFFISIRRKKRILEK